MNNISFKRLNNLIGWGVFIVAFITYAITVERTGSFWDCGEFIAAAFKLQVPHPPGAPLFLMTGRLFSLLAFGDVLRVAYWVNMMSVVASAFTILFMFWTITRLSGKILGKKQADFTQGDIILVIGAGLVGSLAYTWSDSFWFSAVEAEVYGLSSFFTAIVIWASFKWESIDNPAHANRWLVFIAYLVGLSIGVHLLNLVCIPALALIYYFKKQPKPTFWGGVFAFFCGLVVLAIINSGIIPGLPSIAGALEIYFVNSLGLPFTSGVIFFILLFVGALIWGIHYSARKKLVNLNTGLLALSFVLIGYMSYIMVFVRAEFNPPINENNPNSVINFVYYLKREQYGSRPFLYGPTFVDRPSSQKRGEPIYAQVNGRYEIMDYKPDYQYDKGANILLPRMYSTQQNHPQLYRQMEGLAEGQRPTLGDNLHFMFTYQIGHMYWRYFMWNFVGRESDQDGAGTLLPVDVFKKYPYSIERNKAHNNFLMLPFILGLLGVVIQFFRQRKDLLVLGLLFVLTGVALVIYLNSPPVEPRERDYIYVGSFYIFCMWIGFGVISIADGLRKFVSNTRLQSSVAVALGLLVPGIMVAKGWDNHNRNHRYQSVDFAKNLLNSCAPNAILFTGGDNDTFPLWYAQEVEGFRTDVRVCNLSLLGTEWYIDQMKRKTYESEALPISLDRKNYAYGKNDIVPFYAIPSVKGGVNLKEYLKLLKDNNPAIMVPLSSGDMTAILPSSVLFFPVDVAKVKQLGILSPEIYSAVSDTLLWNIGERDLYKSDLMMLDIIANNEWKRPIYFSSTLINSNYLNLKDHMQIEGYAYRLLPVKMPNASDGFVNSKIMNNNMMNKTFYREMDNPNSYYDDTFLGSPVFSARLAFYRLATQLISEGKKDDARKALERSLKTMPDTSIPYDQVSAMFIDPLFQVGYSTQALQIAETMANRSDENLTFSAEHGKSGNNNLDLFILQTILRACQENNQPKAAEKYQKIFQKHAGAYANEPAP